MNELIITTHAVYKPQDSERETQRERERERQTDRQTDRQRQRETDRQTDRGYQIMSQIVLTYIHMQSV